MSHATVSARRTRLTSDGTQPVCPDDRALVAVSLPRLITGNPVGGQIRQAPGRRNRRAFGAPPTASSIAPSSSQQQPISGHAMRSEIGRCCAG